MAEGTRLLSVRRETYRGFESRPLRRLDLHSCAGKLARIQGSMAQLDRAPVYGTGGWRFESSWIRHFFTHA